MIREFIKWVISPWTDFWYHPLYDMSFPKCKLCKSNGEGRTKNCPKDCMGDV